MDGPFPCRRGYTVSQIYNVNSTYSNFDRLRLKAKLRNYRRNPGSVDSQIIETEREELTALFLQLKQAQQLAAVAEPNTTSFPHADVDVWDDLAFDPVPASAEDLPTSAERRQAAAGASGGSAKASSQPVQSKSARIPGIVPIEDQLIALPSNGNTSNIYRELELAHRISAADEQLNHIRNLIAEKSFHFSHIIRVSPRKGVTTRARAAVKKLNNLIAEHCRMYARCRSCILILGAEENILSRYKLLEPTDVAGSTVILNPNEPGSTAISLSWIWQTSARHLVTFTRTDAEVDDPPPADIPVSLIECMLFLFNMIYF